MPDPARADQVRARSPIAGFQAGAAAVAGAGGETRRRISGALSRVLPSSGAGPRPDRLADWLWRMDIEARVAGEQFAEVGIEAAGHPGYLATARLMAEAGPSASAQPAFASTSRTRGTRVLAR